MKKLNLVGAFLVALFAHGNSGFAEGRQHGFILDSTGTFASHLVATRHHSHQVSVSGRLVIANPDDRKTYNTRRVENQSDPIAYFHLQAQNVDFELLEVGQVLTGEICESQVGNYEPNRVVVESAEFIVSKIHLSVRNPFFME